MSFDKKEYLTDWKKRLEDEIARLEKVVEALDEDKIMREIRLKQSVFDMAHEFTADDNIAKDQLKLNLTSLSEEVRRREKEVEALLPVNRKQLEFNRKLLSAVMRHLGE